MKIRITATPIEGRANKHLIKFLAECFAVPQYQVTLVKGELSKIKLIRIEAPQNVSLLENESNIREPKPR